MMSLYLQVNGKYHWILESQRIVKANYDFFHFSLVAEVWILDLKEVLLRHEKVLLLKATV